MKIRILGSASGVPMPKRFNEAVLVQVGEASYLFDAGEPCAATIHTSDVSIYSLRAVFISHSHADHIGGLPMLLQVADLWQKRGPQFRFKPDNALKVYLPEADIADVRTFLRRLHLDEGMVCFSLQIVPIAGQSFYRDETAVVSAFSTSHLSGRAKEEIAAAHAYSFVLQAEGKKLVYSGDLGSPSEIADLANGADVLIVECAHFSPEKLFQALPPGRAKRVVVNHLHPSLCGQEENILEAARAAGHSDVIVAYDGMSVDL